MACTGSQGCRFAATDTKTHAVELSRSLDNSFQILQPVNLHVTGCPNSCAQHYVGDIGLMGVKMNGEEGYKVNLGGGADNDQALARQLYTAMLYSDVNSALHRLFVSYTSSHKQDETFLAFTQRHTVDQLRGMCETAP